MKRIYYRSIPHNEVTSRHVIEFELHNGKQVRDRILSYRPHEKRVVAEAWHYLGYHDPCILERMGLDYTGYIKLRCYREAIKFFDGHKLLPPEASVRHDWKPR